MKIEVRRKTIFWYYRLIGVNGQVLSTSETYYSKGNALRAANKLAKVLRVEVVM